jgi:hypothetical protein
MEELPMRVFLSAALATALFASSAFAENTAAPLAPGKPAGVKQAQQQDNTLILLVGLGLIAGGIAIAASSGGDHHQGSVTTTTTSTSP